LITVNVGLWELRRYDRILMNQKLPDPSPPMIDAEYMGSYKDSTYTMLKNLRTIVGDRTRIRWRQMHTPSAFTNETREAELSDIYNAKFPGRAKKQRDWFHPVKVRQLNEAAREVIAELNEPGVQRRLVGRSDQKAGGETRMDIWPIGDIVSVYPSHRFLKDIIHPDNILGPQIWGEGIMEQLSRAPRR
jgi:hypothetical protein